MIYDSTFPEYHLSGLPDMHTLSGLLDTEQIAQALLEIFQQREQILVAFMTQYGLLPDQIEQVEQHTADGIVWFVRKKTTKE